MPSLVLLVCFFGVGLASSYSQQGCPEPELISPCTCEWFPTLLLSQLYCKNADGMQIRGILKQFENYHNHLSVQIDVSELNNFTVPAYFFPGGQISSTSLSIIGGETIDDPQTIIQFDADSMLSASGLCLLSVFAVEKIILDHFDASILGDCKQTRAFYFDSVNAKSITNFPQLGRLELLSIILDKRWQPTTDISAAKTPNLEYFTWMNDSRATDYFFEPFLNLTKLRQFNIFGNAITTIPNLKNAPATLYASKITTDKCGPELSVNLPSTDAYLYYDLYNDNQAFRVTHLQGSFTYQSINFYCQLNKLDEYVFEPALRQGLTIYLHYTITCDCDFAWLIRQLDWTVPRVYGECNDGRQIRNLNPEDFVHC